MAANEAAQSEPGAAPGRVKFWLLLGTCVVLAALADFLFWQRPVGRAGQPASSSWSSSAPGSLTAPR